MINSIKRQWLRLKQSWAAFKREWRFNLTDSTEHLLEDRPYRIMGIGRLKHPKEYPNDTFELKPPYFGQALMRMNGHVFTLKHTHFNEETGEVRYYDQPQKIVGFKMVDLKWMNDFSYKVSRETFRKH